MAATAAGTPGAGVFADWRGRPALFQVGELALGFTGHPGTKPAIVEDLIMEFEDGPADPGPALAQLRAVRPALEDAGADHDGHRPRTAADAVTGPAAHVVVHGRPITLGCTNTLAAPHRCCGASLRSGVKGMSGKLIIVMANTDPRNGEELGAPIFQATVAAAMSTRWT